MDWKNRLRAESDLGTADRRYITEETPSLDEISDHRTLKDERKQSWREWAGENGRLVIVIILASILGLVLVFHLVTQFAPAALSSAWARRGIVGAVIGVGLGMVLGMRRLRGRMVSWDQLTVKTSDNQARRYYGYYLESDIGSYAMFVPVAGISGFGLRSDVYRISDISRQIVRKRGAPWQEDDPAIMRLDPDWTAVTHTDTGTVAVTHCDGFEPDDQAKESNLRPIIPEAAEKERMEAMRQTLKKEREARKHAEEMQDKYRSQIQQVLEDMDKPHEEKFDQFLEGLERVEEARYKGRRRRRRSRDSDDNGGDVPMAPGKDVEAELEDDDEE